MTDTAEKLALQSMAAAFNKDLTPDDFASFWQKLRSDTAISTKLNGVDPPTDSKSLLKILKDVDRLGLAVEFIESHHTNRPNLRSVFLGLLLAPERSEPVSSLQSCASEISQNPWVFAEHVQNGLLIFSFVSMTDVIWSALLCSRRAEADQFRMTFHRERFLATQLRQSSSAPRYCTALMREIAADTMAGEVLVTQAARESGKDVEEILSSQLKRAPDRRTALGRALIFSRQPNAPPSAFDWRRTLKWMKRSLLLSAAPHSAIKNISVPESLNSLHPAKLRIEFSPILQSASVRFESDPKIKVYGSNPTGENSFDFRFGADWDSYSQVFTLGGIDPKQTGQLYLKIHIIEGPEYSIGIPQEFWIDCKRVATPPEKGILPWLPFAYNRMQLRPRSVRAVMIVLAALVLVRGLSLGIDISTATLDEAAIERIADIEERVLSFARFWDRRQGEQFEESFMFPGRPPVLDSNKWTSSGKYDFGSGKGNSADHHPLQLKSGAIVTKATGGLYDYTAAFNVRMEKGKPIRWRIRTSSPDDGYLFVLTRGEKELQLTASRLRPMRKLDTRFHPVGNNDNDLDFIVELKVKDYTFEGTISSDAVGIPPLNFNFHDDTCTVLSPFCDRAGQFAFVAEDGPFTLYSLTITPTLKSVNPPKDTKTNAH